MIVFQIVGILLLFNSVSCLTFRKDVDIIDPRILATSIRDDCDPSAVPVMDNFDMKRFSGKWFELAKTSSGYIDVSDGVWIIEGSNMNNTFKFSGRDFNQHCIRPIKGKIVTSPKPPGMLNLKYQTYTTHVDEQIRVLYTDYTSVAVLYTCMHHIHREKEACHAAGIFGSIWTRQPHVNVDVFEKATKYLEMACVHKSTLLNRNIVGPCKMDNLDERIDDFPVPDDCYQTLDLGSCRGSMQRYFYDSIKKECKTFTYGGCGGNKNNFMSLPECEQKCIATGNIDPVCMTTAKCGLHCSPCCSEDMMGCVTCDCEHIVVDDFLNCVESPSQCPDGCQAEHFPPECYVCRCHEEKPPESDIVHMFCNEVKAEGDCDERLDRYYYNVVKGNCERFLYSGCNGNNNNFKSLNACREKCEVSDKLLLRHSPTKVNDPNDPNNANTLPLNTWITLLIGLLFHKVLFQVL